MDKPNTDVIQGTLDLLILKTLSLEPMHGFGIARRIEQISRGVFKVNPGSLLVALQRLERAGWLDAEWRQTENARRARFYTLTRAGRKQLELETADWTRRASAVARLLKAEGIAHVALAPSRARAARAHPPRPRRSRRGRRGPALPGRATAAISPAGSRPHEARRAARLELGNPAA